MRMCVCMCGEMLEIMKCSKRIHTHTHTHTHTTAYSWFNLQGIHTLPEAVNIIDNIVLRQHTGNAT